MTSPLSHPCCVSTRPSLIDLPGVTQITRKTNSPHANLTVLLFRFYFLFNFYLFFIISKLFIKFFNDFTFFLLLSRKLMD